MGFSFKKALGFAAAPITLGTSLLGSKAVGGPTSLGGIKDLLGGKKEGGSSADPIAADVRRVQKKALETQEKGLGFLGQETFDPKAQAALQIANQRNLAKSGAADQRRQLQAQIARKGLGRSSLGLTSALGIEKQQGDRLRTIDAQRPQLERQLGQEKTNRFLDVGGKVLASQNAPIQFRDIEGKRGGGISGLLGAGVGGYFGGPAGASAGYNIGSGLGGLL